MTKQRATILIVEDEITLLEGIAELMAIASERYEMNVLTALNGEAALRVMREQSPDLIVSDIMMPRMDGFELLAQVRRRAAWVHIPFIFLSAKGNRQDVLEGRRRGAELYITKPFSSIEFLELIESQLDRTFARRTAWEKQLLSLKRDILQLLNHEFRTPLTFVVAYKEMLSEGLQGLEELERLQEYLRGIQTGCIRLTRLVENFILILEITSGEAAVRFEQQARPIENFGTLLIEAGSAWQPAAQKRNIQVEWDISDGLPPVLGHPPSLRKALDRLLDNAIKFTPVTAEPRRVQLSAKQQEGWVVLSIADEGIGFPPYVYEQLFDPFFQYNRQYWEQQGAGSGLAIVKGIVDLHGGRIEVHSEEGRGSIFQVMLPEALAPEPERLQPEPNGDTLPQVTILLVEDDRFLLYGLRELLELYVQDYRVEVLTATDGQKGLEMLAKHRPDLIISDVMMPIMDGYAFLREVRRNPDWVQIPVIFLTARGEEDDIHRGYLSGVEQYIPKPYDVDELLQTVTTQLDRHFQVENAVHQSFDEVKRGILGLLRPDFMVPLNAINEHSQKLLQGLQRWLSDSDIRRSLVGISEASETLSRLTEDFITLAEFRTGEAEVSFEANAELLSGPELRMHLLSYCNQLRLELEAEGVAFDFVVASHLPAFYCDIASVTQALDRLLDILLDLCQSVEQPRIAFLAQADAETLRIQLTAADVPFSTEAADTLVRFSQHGEQSASLPDHIRAASLLVVNGILSLHQGHLLPENGPEGGRLVVLMPVKGHVPQRAVPAGNAL